MRKEAQGVKQKKMVDVLPFFYDVITNSNMISNGKPSDFPLTCSKTTSAARSFRASTSSLSTKPQLSRRSSEQLLSGTRLRTAWVEAVRSGRGRPRCRGATKGR